MLYPNHPNYPKYPNSSRPGYEHLIVYMLGKIIQDLTIQFCRQFVTSRRQTEQMEQAARSNPQNIAEGYTNQSLSSYIQLASVAQGSNEELTKDYQDFLRQRGLSTWPKDHERVRGFREFRAFWIPNSPNTLNTPLLPKDPTEAANMLLTFCQMEGYLLAKHVESLKDKHTREGGFRENLLKKRLEYRKTI